MINGHKHHFSKLIEELKSSETDEYAGCVLAFINCLIAGSVGLEARVHLRNELLGTYTIHCSHMFIVIMPMCLQLDVAILSYSLY